MGGPSLGVDVGGPAKGFDAAVIRGNEVLELRGRLRCEDVIAIVKAHVPGVVAVDSPRSAAPHGHTTREGERLLAKSVCGIRWTPNATKLHASDYYAWIVEGLKLYKALEAFESTVIEVFPTASWTRWHGPRGKQRRSAWSKQALAGLEMTGVPKRTNQDQRDAIAAAVTAQQHALKMTEPFGDILVPIKQAAN